MPKGPQGQKRPADVIGKAVKVMRIATGEEADDIDAAKSAAVSWERVAAKLGLRSSLRRSVLQ